MSDKVEKLFIKLANEIQGYTPPQKVEDNYSAYTTQQNAEPQKMATNYQTIPPSEPGKVADNEYYHMEYPGGVTEKSAAAAQSLLKKWNG